MPALLALLAGFAAGCLHRGDVIYTSFGPADPAGDTRIVQAWEKSRVKTVGSDDVDALGRPASRSYQTLRKLTDAERRSVVVLVDTLPEGIESSESGLRSTGPHVVLGKFSIRYKDEREKTEVLDDIRLLAIAAGANMALISWTGGSQESASGVAGVTIRYDLSKFDSSKLQSGKIPSI